jgi:hypothetical protein
MMTMSGRLMSERIDVLRLTFYTAPTVVVLLLPFWHRLERRQLAVYMAEAPSTYACEQRGHAHRAWSALALAVLWRPFGGVVGGPWLRSGALLACLWLQGWCS